MDRTREFLSIVRAAEASGLKGEAIGGGARKRRPPPKPVSNLGEFHQAASAIARDIHATSQQLSHLTRLVKRRGLFDDPAEEINTLVSSIKEGVQGLNAQLDAAQGFVDSRKRSAAGTQSSSHSVNVVGSLKAELMETTKVFKGVLEERSHNLKAQADRKDKFFTNKSSAALNKPLVFKPMQLPPPPTGVSQPALGVYGRANNGTMAAAGNGTNSAIIGHRQPSILPRPSAVTSLPEREQEVAEDPDVPLLGQSIMGQQQQQQLIPAVSYYEERATAMEDVQRHITELGTIFGRLATMLQDQREMVDSIHDDIEDASENVNRGQLALLSTLTSLQGGRMLAMKVSGVLLAFILFFVIFLV